MKQNNENCTCENCKCKEKDKTLSKAKDIAKKKKEEMQNDKVITK